MYLKVPQRCVFTDTLSFWTCRTGRSVPIRQAIFPEMPGMCDGADVQQAVSWPIAEATVRGPQGGLI